MQTRLYQTKDEISLLSAGVAVLQDMGYSVDETETDLGLVTASKTIPIKGSDPESEPDSNSDAFLAFAIAVVVIGGLAYALNQKKGRGSSKKDAPISSGSSLDDITYDVKQKIRVSLVTSRSPHKKDEYRVRVTFQRMIWNNKDKITRMETLKNKKLYQTFFNKLSKSIFLEGHKI